MNDPPKSSKGFTLVELLAVAAALAVLASLMLPSINAAKRKAERTTCLSNLRQINSGVRMYADDSQDASPSLGPASAANITNVSSLYSGYKELMKRYVEDNGEVSSRDRLFACPADRCFASFVTNGSPP